MWTNVLIWVLQGILVLVCLFMVLIILMQRSKQDGLGAAFGSGMTDSVFGADTSNVLSKMTVWCTALFFILTLALSSIYARKEGMSKITGELKASAEAAAPTPAVAPTPAPAPAPAQVKSEATTPPLSAPMPLPAPTPAPAPAPAAESKPPAPPAP